MTKDQILTELAGTRAALARDGDALRAELDVPAKLRVLVRRKPMAWLGGASALGWMLAGPRTKTRVVKKFVTVSDKSGKAGKQKEKSSASRPTVLVVLLALIKFGLPIFKPVLTAYAGRQLANIASKLAK